VFGAAAFSRAGFPVLVHRSSAASMAARCGACLRTLRVGRQGLAGSACGAQGDKCIHPVPVFGRIGSCADVDALDRYFAALDGHVGTLLAAGIGLPELRARCDLPEFASWDGYAALHVQNACRAYLRMERDSSRSRCPRFPEQGLINFLDTPPQALQAVRTMELLRG
jgi:hypothetical protein